jgi:serine/threonine-protein kinase
MDEIVMRGLARDRNKRYPSAREMALAIEATMPLAPPSQVGRWVDALAGDALAERMEQIAGIESAVSEGAHESEGGSAMLPVPAADQTIPARPPIVPSPPAAPRMTMEPVMRTDARRVLALATESSLGRIPGLPRWGRRRLAVILAVTVVGLAIFAGMRLRPRHEALAEVAPAIPKPVETHAVAVPMPPPPPAGTWVPASQPMDEAPAVQAEALPPAPRSSSPPRPYAPHPVVGPPRPATPQRAPATALPEPQAPAAPPNKPSCDPPYWYDAEGNKHYYRHCSN